MIPYIELHTIALGPFTLQVWGTLVALGILVGLMVALRRGRTLGLSRDLLVNAATWSLLAALIGARLGHVLFYEPRYFWEHPWEIVSVWNGGMSVMAALIATALWIKAPVDEPNIYLTRGVRELGA